MRRVGVIHMYVVPYVVYPGQEHIKRAAEQGRRLLSWFVMYSIHYHRGCFIDYCCTTYVAILCVGDDEESYLVLVRRDRQSVWAVLLFFLFFPNARQTESKHWINCGEGAVAV